MTHIAIQVHLYGNTADWMEKVSDEQYQAKQSDACRLVVTSTPRKGKKI